MSKGFATSESKASKDEPTRPCHISSKDWEPKYRSDLGKCRTVQPQSTKATTAPGKKQETAGREYRPAREPPGCAAAQKKNSRMVAISTQSNEQHTAKDSASNT